MRLEARHAALRKPITAGARHILVAALASFIALLPYGELAAAQSENTAQASGRDETGGERQSDDRPTSQIPSKSKGDENKQPSGDKSPTEAPADKASDKDGPDNPAKAPKKGEAAGSGDIWQRKQLLGDIGGVRPFLARYGASLNIVETDEVLGNPTGGIRQGAIAEGLTDLSLGVDLRPTLGVRGNFYARAYQIHGPGLTFENIHSLDTISSIEAAPTTRLVAFWYEHHFDRFRIRVGEQTITTDFLSPETARLFVNGAFGWPTLPSVDLPSGGPAYPLGALAARLRYDPTESLTLFAAVFNGDPTGAGVGGSQLADASGTAFRTSDGAFAISELRYNPDSSDKNGTYRFGGWYNSERFRDLRLDENGFPLANPSRSRARLHNGGYSFYAAADQPLMIDEAAHTSVAVFVRAMGAPGDRNLVDFYADAGLAYKGPFGREDDQAGIAVAYAQIGQSARDFAADMAQLTGRPVPMRSSEAVLELTYRIQLAPWLQLQPDFQYVFNPGGGISSPNTPGTRVGDAAVLGFRSTVTF